MKLYYLEQFEDLSGLNAKDREARLNEVFSHLFGENQIVQEVIIDGLVFHENYEPILLDRMQEIQEVRLQTVPGEVLANDVIEELKGYLPKVQKAIGSISDLFYGDMSAEDWVYFSQLVDGLSWVGKSVQVVRDQLGRYPGTDALEPQIVAFNNRFLSLMEELEGCLQREEQVAAGDLIKYELGELVDDLHSAIQSKVKV